MYVFSEKHVDVFGKPCTCFFSKAMSSYSRLFILLFPYTQKAGSYSFRVARLFVLVNETVSRLPLCKDLLTLDLKYYEKNSMQR